MVTPPINGHTNSRNYPQPLVMPDAFPPPRPPSNVHRFDSYTPSFTDYGDTSTYTSTELNEALEFNYEVEPDFCSLTATDFGEAEPDINMYRSEVGENRPDPSQVSPGGAAIKAVATDDSSQGSITDLAHLILQANIKDVAIDDSSQRNSSQRNSSQGSSIDLARRMLQANIKDIATDDSSQGSIVDLARLILQANIKDVASN